jgi:hypothetical protein
MVSGQDTTKLQYLPRRRLRTNTPNRGYHQPLGNTLSEQNFRSITLWVEITNHYPIKHNLSSTITSNFYSITNSHGIRESWVSLDPHSSAGIKSYVLFAINERARLHSSTFLTKSVPKSTRTPSETSTAPSRGCTTTTRAEF